MKEQLIKLQDKVAAPSTSGDRGFGAERANYAGEEHQSGHNWRSNGGEGPRHGLVTGRSMVGEEALGHMAEAGRSNFYGANRQQILLLVLIRSGRAVYLQLRFMFTVYKS